MTTPQAPQPAQARLLIIRFSSFGDIVQALSVPASFQAQHPNAEIHWLVRDEFRALLEPHPLIKKVISFRRNQGLWGLIHMAWQLADQNYTHIYDAHCNLRSRIVKFTLWLKSILRFDFKTRRLTRPKNRLRRFLLFRLHWPVLPMPFRGAESFLWPLKSWGISQHAPPAPQFFTRATLPADVQTELNLLPRPRIALAASAAWSMKRWPVEHWQQLIAICPEMSFVLLGGPEDQFLQSLQSVAPSRCLNLAGRLSLAESSALLKQADVVIANDTGILHVSDQLGRPTIALIGPTAFGYPSQMQTSRVLEVELACKPCSKDGRGKCQNAVYQLCLKQISPDEVRAAALKLLKTPSAQDSNA